MVTKTKWQESKIKKRGEGLMFWKWQSISPICSHWGLILLLLPPLWLLASLWPLPLVRLLWFSFQPKSWVLLGSACPETLEFFICLCFWCKYAKTVRGSEAGAVWTSLLWCAWEPKVLIVFSAHWRHVGDCFILAELHGTCDLKCTRMRHLFSTSGWLEHLATTSSTFLRS